MENFELYAPTKVLFGKNTQKQVGAEAAQFGKRVLLHYGSGWIKKSGLYDQVMDSLKGAGCEIFELGGVRPNPRVSLCREGIALCRAENIDAVVAVGGGSVIDSAKCICVGLFYDGDVWDLFCCKSVLPTQKLPLVTVVTMAGAGSEMSMGTVLSNEQTGEKLGLRAGFMRAEVSIINPVLSFTTPAYQVASGCTDIMSHSLERILSPVTHNMLAEAICIDTARLVLKFTELTMKKPEDYEVRAQISWAAAYAMGGVQHSGEINDGVLHQLEHELGARYDIAHGAGMAAIMPEYFRLLTKLFPARMAELMSKLFDLDYDFMHPEHTALQGIEMLEAFFKSIGMPICLKDLGIDGTHLRTMAQHACARTGTVGHFYPLDAEKAEELYKSCL